MPEIIKLADYQRALHIIGEKGFPTPPLPGWRSLNQLYRPFPGYMTTVTGIPGHGKSEWLDALLVNLAIQYGMKFVLFSPENFPVALHAIKMIEKVAGIPYGRMEKEGQREVEVWLDNHFTWINPAEENCTVSDILRLVDQVKQTFGANGMVIDPWNEVDHQRPAGLTETEYISQSLTKIRRFSREKKVHSWIVAHPTKLPKNRDTGKYDPPTPYDISGSGHWRNKSDFCITVHREDFETQQADVYIQKVKFKHFGKVGCARLDYDFACGRFKDTDEPNFKLPEPPR